MSIWLTVVGVPRFTACICDPESVNLGVVSQVTALSNIGDVQNLMHALITILRKISTALTSATSKVPTRISDS